LKNVRAGFGRPLLVRREWRPRVVADPAHLNVVLVVVDSMRPDHLGCYGATRPASPYIDRLAADAIVYEDAQSPSSWTWPAVASLFTGLWPPSHGVTGFDRCYLSDSLTTIAERFAQDGCTTLGVTASPFISHTKNFQQGFEEWREFPLSAAPRLGELFQDWVRRYSGYQFFAFVHFTDPRWPYNPPPRFGEMFASPDDAAAMRHAVNELRAQRAAPVDPARGRGPVLSEEDVLPKLSDAARIGLYDGEIACVDYEIGRMWRALEDERLLDRTIFVVTSTHGELLAAGPQPSVGGSLDPELLRVPLIIRDPRQRPRRETGIVDVTRLQPTLLRITGVEDEEDAALPVPGGVTASTPLRPALPPWDPTAPRVAFAHTARARLPGHEEPCELVEIASGEGRLTMEPSGTVVEFSGDAKSAAGKEARASLTSQIRGWYEECRRSAVSRPFQKMDSATESLRDANDRH
jgi:arylsulfatase A-like enzyme